MKISSFRRYYVYYWYSQFIFVFCPRKWKCSTWWAGQWTHLEPRGSPQRNGETHVCIVCTSWYREVSDGARPRPCLPTGRSWALCLGHSCQNRMCPQLAPGSWEEQRGCTGVGVAFAPAMEFVGRWKCRSRLLFWGRQRRCQEEYPYSIWLFPVNIALWTKTCLGINPRVTKNTWAWFCWLFYHSEKWVIEAGLSFFKRFTYILH